MRKIMRDAKLKEKSTNFATDLQYAQSLTTRCSNGGMVDTKDLKSFDHCDRAGSSPASSTT